MKDLEKMKVEFEQKLKFAQMENELSKLFPDDIECSVIGKSHTQNGNLHTIIKQKGLKPLTLMQCGAVLSELPRTEKINVHIGQHKYILLPYKLQLHRGFNDSITLMNIEYIHNEYHISLTLGIENNDDGIMQFLKETHRRLSESEVSTYIKFVTNENCYIVDYHKFLTWNCGDIVQFYGGYHIQKNECVINTIIEHIKYRYEFNG